MLSPIGKALRHLRLEKDERLLDMAERLEVTSSFLSAIEMGRKAPPRDFAERVINSYALPQGTAAEIRSASMLSQSTFRIDAQGVLARRTAGLLASEFGTLDEGQLTAIQRIIRRSEEDG